MSRVLVFGVFDGLHPGHRSFLEQARAEGDTVVVAVARDSVVERLKGRRPEVVEAKRAQALLDSGLADEAFLGDDVPGTYGIVDRVGPDVICLGHDQEALCADLGAWMARRGMGVRLVSLRAFRPDVYKSSRLKQTRGDDYSSSGIP